MFKEDFETERRDREKAAGKYDDTLCRLQKEIASLTSQLHLEKARLEGELEKAKMVFELHVYLNLLCVCVILRERESMPVMGKILPRHLAQSMRPWCVFCC